MNNWKEKELEFGSYEWGEKRAKYYCNLQLEAIPKAEKLAKSLDLKLFSSTWYHLEYKNESLYTNRF